MTTHPPPQDPIEPDGELPGEAKLSALYRQLPRSEPGPALDAAVLRAAAAAIASETQQGEPGLPSEALAAAPAAGKNKSSVVTAIGTARPRKAPRWLVGLACAATLVLVAGVAWHMREMPNGAPAAAADAEYRTAAPAASTVAPVARASAPMAPLASAVVPKQESLRKPSLRATESATQRANTLDSSVIADERRKPPHVVPATALVAQSRAISMPPPVDEISSNAPVSANREAYTSANPPPLQTGQVPAAPAPPAPMAANAIAFSAKTMLPPPAATAASSLPAPAPTPAPAPAIAGVPVNAATVAMAAPSHEHVIINASRSAPMPTLPTPPTPPSSTSPIDTVKRPSDTPAQELAKITALFAQHNDAEAQRRLLQFHRDHPTWNLDSSLRARLGEP